MVAITQRELVSAIPVRYSCRHYTAEPIAAELERRLTDPLGLRCLGVGQCRAEYIHAPGQLEQFFTGIIGSYGKIKGASALIALIVPANDAEMGKLQAGYLGEQYVLRATHLGLGTCWVGGMFHFKTLMGRLSVGPDETVASVIAVGWPKKSQDTLGKIVHAFARRKSLSQIAGASLRSGPSWLSAALEAVQRAPSAVNLQPWYFGGNPSHVELKASRKSSLVPVDLGIAMLHFELAAREGGYNGKWHCSAEAHVFQEEGKR